MRKIASLIIGVLLLSVSSYGQSSTTTDTIRKEKIGITVWGDFGKPIHYLIGDNERYEFGGGLVIAGRWQLSGSYGASNLLYDRGQYVTNGSYQVEGAYWRVGLDYVRGGKAKTYVGLRYATSTFSDRWEAVLSSDLWEDYEINGNRDALSASWYELVLGTEVPILPGLYIGWLGRARFLPSYPGFDEIPVFRVPGYGLVANPVNLHLNAVLRYRIGF